MGLILEFDLLSTGLLHENSVKTLLAPYKNFVITGANEDKLNLMSSNGWHSDLKYFKPEKDLEFFRLKNFEAIDAYPGKLE